MRSTNAAASRKRKKKVLKAAKGYWGQRSKIYRRAIETLRRAYAFAYTHRRLKKREFRSLWIIRINAAVRNEGITYQEFIHGLKESKILLSRDILAQLAAQHPEVFAAIINKVKKPSEIL